MGELTSPSTIDTGASGRVNHFVDITNLGHDQAFEYRVRHLRAGNILATYESGFQTRLSAGDNAPFQFVAYGDSAYTPNIQNFRNVQDRINQIDPAFAVLLGDNAYDSGTHAELDARFDPTLNPEATAWNAGHIDYLGVGNHDVGSASGQQTEDDFAVPIPVTGVTAPAEPPAGERPEHNYSFDYGLVHFVTLTRIASTIRHVWTNN